MLTIIFFTTVVSVTVLQVNAFCCCDPGDQCVGSVDHPSSQEQCDEMASNMSLSCVFQDITTCEPNPCVDSDSSSESDSAESDSAESDFSAAEHTILNLFDSDNMYNIGQASIVGYWQGYDIDDQHPFPLNKVPEKFNYIPIAFVNPINESNDLATNWKFMDSFYYSKEEIKTWIEEINMRTTNQKVLFSISDSPDFHWYPDVNIDEFAKSIAQTANEWDLGGININAESEMNHPQNTFVKTFTTLIRSLKKYLSPDKIITYTCMYSMNTEANTNYTYYHQLILQECANDIEYITTMNYWYDTPKQIHAYRYFANAIGDLNKVGIGVKAGNNNNSALSVTKIETVKECATWLRVNNMITQKRMMLWTTTRDIQMVTQQQNETYLNAIYDNLKPHLMSDMSDDSDTNTNVESQHIVHVEFKVDVGNVAATVVIFIAVVANLCVCYCYYSKK